jgi:hypothetical protein
MPFVLLVLGLLGGGLVCLLVVNTTLGATSFRISQLQSANASLARQAQTLLGQVADEQSPAGIEQRAYQLGMRAETEASILDLRNGRYYRVPDHPGAAELDGVAPPAASASADRKSTHHNHAGAGKTSAHTHGARHNGRPAAASKPTAGQGTATGAGSSR